MSPAVLCLGIQTLLEHGTDVALVCRGGIGDKQLVKLVREEMKVQPERKLLSTQTMSREHADTVSACFHLCTPSTTAVPLHDNT